MRGRHAERHPAALTKLLPRRENDRTPAGSRSVDSLPAPEVSSQRERLRRIAGTVDPFLDETGGALAGIVLEAASFPGWDSLGALIAHLRFVRDHHRRVRKVAIVTDALLGDLAENLASHFVAAKIRHFPAGEVDAARLWVLERQ